MGCAPSPANATPPSAATSRTCCRASIHPSSPSGSDGRPAGHHIDGREQRWSRAVQPDLFGPPPLAGLSTAEGIVTPEEERRLTTAIDAAELAPFRYQRWEGRRLTATYGWRYDFEDGS